MLITTIQPPVSPTAIIQNIQSGQAKNILKALRSAIILNSQGVNTIDLNPTIIKEVIEFFSINSTKSKQKISNYLNSIRKAFYLLLELIPKTDSNGKVLAEFFLLTNQIRKDLQHPNEYYRAIVMKTLSRIIYFSDQNKYLLECFDALQQPILSNLKHQHFYTRRNAILAYFHCLNAEKSVLVDQLKRESNVQLMKVCFTAIQGISEEKINFNNETKEIYMESNFFDFKSIPEDLLQLMLDYGTAELLNECIQTKKCKSLAFLLLLDKFDVDFSQSQVLELIRMIEEPNFKEIGLQIILRNISKISHHLNVSVLVHLLDCDTKEVLFEIIDIIKKPIDKEVIRKMLKEEILKDSFDDDFLVFVLEKYSDLVKNEVQTKKKEKKTRFQKKAFPEPTDSDDDAIEKKIQALIIGDNPRTAYAALTLSSNLVHLLEKIKFGKVFRKAVDIVISRQDNFQLFVDLCEKQSFITSTVHNYGIIAMALFKIFFVSKSDYNTRLQQILVSMLDNGKSDNNFDFTTYEIISQVLIDISEKNIHTLTDQEDVEKEETPKKTNLTFSFLKQKKEAKISDKEAQRPIIKQLSGYTDPLYVEAFITVTRLKITVSLLIINTTSHMITNILPEFTISSNITGDRTYGFNLEGGSIVKKGYSFKVNEVVNGFLTGYIQFSIGKNKNMSVALGEVKFKVNEYLLEKHISRDDFKSDWLILEWENSYTSRFKSSLNVNEIFDQIRRELKCCIIDSISTYDTDYSTSSDDSLDIPVQSDTDDFIVANLCCTTLLAEDILMNMKIHRENNTVSIDCRMRSASEQIVKSLSVVFGECLRAIKE